MGEGSGEVFSCAWLLDPWSRWRRLWGIEGAQPELVERGLSEARRFFGLQLVKRSSFGCAALSRCSAIPARSRSGLLSKDSCSKEGAGDA